MQPLTFEYGGSIRRVKPKQFRFKTTKYRSEPQWFMEALDIDKNEIRTFAMEDIQPIKMVEALRPFAEIGRNLASDAKGATLVNVDLLRQAAYHLRIKDGGRDRD